MQLPETSHEAHEKVSNEMLRSIYQRIVDALKVLGLANYEEIALYLNVPDKNMISRRTKEMEGLQMIYKPGTKSLTRSGRNAFQYALTGSNVTVPALPERQPKLTAVDFANVLINKTKMGKIKQCELFQEQINSQQ